MLLARGLATRRAFVGRILKGVTEFIKGVTDVIISVLSRA